MSISDETYAVTSVCFVSSQAYGAGEITGNGGSAKDDPKFSMFVPLSIFKFVMVLSCSLWFSSLLSF